ncbi:MAG: response regulator [Chloroflexi bacterium]|nr:response regulator [Chloroflexota bacterium]
MRQILIVDDDLQMLELQARVLIDAGYSVSTAETVADALRMLDGEQPDLVLLDVVLPDGDGIDLCRQIKSRSGMMYVFVVLVSGIRSGTEDSAVGLEAGADGFIARPISNRELVARIESLLRIRDAQVEAQLRARQQAAIAQLGQMALDVTSLEDLFHEAVRSVACVLEAPHCAVLESDPSCRQLALTAGVGWGAGQVGYVALDVEPGSQAGYALAADAPVVVTDLSQETRFTVAPLLSEHKLTSGVTLAIPGRDEPFGLFLAFSEAHRRFTGQDVSFLEAVVNVLAAAVQHSEAEEALRRERDRAQRYLDIAGVIMLVFDPCGTIQMINRQGCQVLGYPDDALIGSNWFDVCLPSRVREDVRAALLDVISGHYGRYHTYENPILTAWGEERIISWRNAVLTNDSGTPTGLLASGTDVTEQRRAETERARFAERMREQVQRIQRTIDAVPEGVLLFKRDGTVLLGNSTGDSALALLGGIGVGGVLTHLGDQSLATLLSPSPHGLWHQVTLGSSDPRTFEVIARPIDAGPEADEWVMVVRDVTEQREIQNRTQHQERLAAVGQLAGGVAHDFNNLLTTIMLNAQVSLAQPNLSPIVSRGLESILNESRQAAQLVQQILDFSRRSPLTVEPVDLGTVVHDTLVVLRRTIPETVQIRTEFGDGPFVVQADSTRMRQVLTNLVLNARDAMAGGGVLRIGLKRVSADPGGVPRSPGVEPGEWICLTVTDSGTGIPASALPHMFEPFFTTKPSGQGTGLGLAQVYGIVVQHRGRVDVKTEQGRGTTFSAYLPAWSGTSVDSAGMRSTAHTPSGHGETVLLVEDQQRLREMGRDVLEALGYRVLTAAEGHAALDQYRRDSSINVILTDIVMPGMGGRELLRAVQTLDPQARVLGMTGYLMGEDEAAVQNEGFLRIIRKPFDVAELGEAIRYALDVPNDAHQAGRDE